MAARLKRTIAFILTLFVFTGQLFSTAGNHTEPQLKRLRAEILEVEELKEPLGSAIYTVKDIVSGTTIRLYASVYSTVVRSGNEVIEAGDVSGGSRAVIIYKRARDQELPEVVFAQIINSYYL